MRDHQSAFAPLAGLWAVQMSVRDEHGNVITSDSVRSRKELFGGRYVREMVSGTFAGKPHNKLTIFVWNETRGRYEYVTADDNDAVILLYASRPAQAGDEQEIDLYTDYLMPDGEKGRPQLVTIRTRLAIQNEDRHRLQNFYIPAGGSERLFLQYDYERLSVDEGDIPL